MPVEILPNIYKIAVPLPDHALRSVNSYVILSDDRNLVIDTGWNRIACLEALLQGLEAIGADRSRTDLFLTHLHADHAVLAGGRGGGDVDLRLARHVVPTGDRGGEHPGRGS